jgi:hypothetical protein
VAQWIQGYMDAPNRSPIKDMTVFEKAIEKYEASLRKK